jgi:hypothetical protein
MNNYPGFIGVPVEEVTAWALKNPKFNVQLIRSDSPVSKDRCAGRLNFVWNKVSKVVERFYVG